MNQFITIRRPDDFHLHLRDGEMLPVVITHSARQFARAMVMPNLKPPVTTVDAAVDYRQRIKAALPSGAVFEPLMTCYLCDSTDPREVRRGWDEKVFSAAKLYPAGATAHSEYGVTSIDRIAGVLDAMQSIGMPLLIHGESTDPEVDVFDREAVFIERTLVLLLERFQGLKVVLEHITTEQAVEFVGADKSGRLAATITPQHLMLNRNAMFTGGMHPHYYCLPVLKREKHRLALRRAATSGSKSFFLGTDSAPHERAAKEAASGCAGIFSAPIALEGYVSVFDEEGALDRFEAFASQNGSQFYGLPLNEGVITLKKAPRLVPERIELAAGKSIHPFLAGTELKWCLEAPQFSSNHDDEVNTTFTET